MTMIDKAEALRIVMEECYKDREMKLATRIEERIAALPARGVGVTWYPFDTAPRDGSRFLAQGGGLDAVDICSYNARVGCWDCGAVTLDDTDHEPEGYNRPAQWMPITALATTDAAHAREARKDDPECTCCGGTGITYQTERPCACQTQPERSNHAYRVGFAAGRATAIREAAETVQAGDTVQAIQRRILALLDKEKPHE